MGPRPITGFDSPACESKSPIHGRSKLQIHRPAGTFDMEGYRGANSSDLLEQGAEVETLSPDEYSPIAGVDDPQMGSTLRRWCWTVPMVD